jgi:hypothetical protein
MPLTRPGRAKALARVERAVVQFSRNGGRGILVPGGFILTAAHCVSWSLEGGMVLGDDYLERVQTADGEELLLAVLAVEPVADVAVLGAPDNQRLLDQAIAFDEFTARTKPAALFRGALEPSDIDERLGPLNHCLPALVYNHDRQWVKATASVVCPGQPTIWLEAEKCIEGGSSGGPVVTPAGEVIGVISNSEKAAPGRKDRIYTGCAVNPLLALPIWVANVITTDKN